MNDVSIIQSRILLCLATLLPFWNLFGAPEVLVSIPDSELPVKLWGYVRFWDWSIFWGGQMDHVGFPQTGMLNNPDIVATFLVGMFRPIVGLIWSFNLLLISVMGANIVGGYFLCRQFGCIRWSAVVGAIIFGWQPLLVSYGFSSVITDLIHLWPYAFGLGFIQRGLQEENFEDGRWAGVSLALGFITCPYNFVLFIPIIPILLIWMWTQNRSLMWPLVMRLALFGSVLVTLYAFRIGYVMRGGSSLVDSDMVDSVRHSYPFDGLRAEKETRFTAFLAEMFGVLPRPVVVMEQVARFYRHFQWGTSVVIVGLWGLLRVPQYRLFFFSGILIGLGASIGPFAIVSPMLELKDPWNLMYLYAYYLPLGKMILEPFRYALVAGTFLALVVGLGVQRLGRFGWMVGLFLIGETFWRSPTLPFPIRTIPWDERMETLPISRTGGVVHLPFFVPKSNRFDRTHFIYQLQHDRPISDPIMGFPSPYMIENSFLCTLIHTETVAFPLQFFPCGRVSIPKSILQLATDNVAAVVIDPAKYASEDWSAVQRILSSDLPLNRTEYQGLIILEPTDVEQ